MKKKAGFTYGQLEQMKELEQMSIDTQSSQTIAKPNVICRYYNSGNSLGVIGIQSNNIHHQDGEYTFLTGREPDYQWIMSCDLYDTYEEAKNAQPARFFNGI